ncbi:hypothetical protein D3C78_1665810 [compost metagenome]
MTQIQADHAREVIEAEVEHFQTIETEVQMRQLGKSLKNANRLRSEANLVVRQAQDPKLRQVSQADR